MVNATILEPATVHNSSNYLYNVAFRVQVTIPTVTI